MIDSILIHTDEIVLKGGNRPFFERHLRRNILLRLGGLFEFKLSMRKGLILIKSTSDLTNQIDQIRNLLNQTFGIGSFMLARCLPANLDKLEDAVVELVKNWSGTFRATVRRSDKSFPYSSVEVARRIGGFALQSNSNLQVDLHKPEKVITVEINDDGIFLSADREVGPGGLPTNTTGTMVALISGGIDSPVAAWKMMRRGCKVFFVHCHSYPHVGRESIEKVRRLVKQLSYYQGQTKLFLVPIAAAQREIMAKTEPGLRIVLYRRLMLSLAEEIAERENASGLVTGDSLGQVASQTPENILTVNAVVKNKPVYRPLIGEDKRDIITTARTIGTYGISIEPHDDCCSIFLPDHPELKSNPDMAAREEKKLGYLNLIKTSLDTTECETFDLQVLE